jgi:D-arabinose 1-dehydrogenase-like Zn-dependent alcohol dehydrogenase
MLSNGWRVHFSLVASRADHDEMLHFAASHGVRPHIQTYKFDGAPSIERAFKDIKENRVRYRVVLEL